MLLHHTIRFRKGDVLIDTKWLHDTLTNNRAYTAVLLDGIRETVDYADILDEVDSTCVCFDLPIDRFRSKAPCTVAFIYTDTHDAIMHYKERLNALGFMSWRELEARLQADVVDVEVVGTAEVLHGDLSDIGLPMTPMRVTGMMNINYTLRVIREGKIVFMGKATAMSKLNSLRGEITMQVKTHVDDGEIVHLEMPFTLQIGDVVQCIRIAKCM